jgi:hypothetical protein
MLNERLYCCFRGRRKRFDVLREWLVMGDPFRTPLTPARLLNCGFGRADAM